MKKAFLMLTLMLTSTVMMAQWTKPEWPIKFTPSFEKVIISEDSTELEMAQPQYLYNVETMSFMLGANNYGTRASVDRTKGWKVKFLKTENGLQFQDNRYDNDVWNVAALDCDGGMSAWIDGQTRQGDGTWSIEELGDNLYKLHNKFATNEDGTLLPWGVKKDMTDTRIYFNADEDTYATTWAFVSPEEYAKFLEAVAEVQDDIAAYDGELARYNSAMSLKDLLDKLAETKVNTEDQKAVYNNIESTLDELKAACDSLNKVYSAWNALKDAIVKAEAEYPGINLTAQKEVLDNGTDAPAFDAAKASIEDTITAFLADKEGSLDNPLEITSTITALLPGNDTELNANWTRVWTGNGTVGTFHMNTWSTEGNSDGTSMTTPFIEDWVGKGSILSDQKYYHNAVKVKPGVYQIKAKIRLYNESEGATQNEGAYLFANNNRTALLDQNEGSVQDYYNGMLFYWNDNFKTTTIVGPDSLLTFGVQIENANFNWVAAKNFRIYNLGSSFEAYNYVREHTELLASRYGESTYAQKDLLNAYNAAYDAYQDATDAKGVNEAYATISLLADSVQANVAAYKAYADAVQAYIDANTNGEYNYNGDLWGEFVDFINSEFENTIEKGEATTAEMKENLTKLNAMFDEAVKNSIEEGSDVTNLLVNPTFDGSFNGWTNSEGKEVAGKLGTHNVEVYDGVVDVMQVVEGIPNGVYALSCQAFERPAGNGKYDGSEESKVFLYMNSFQTPVQNIVKDAMPEDQAEDMVNCYIGESQSGVWPYDYLVDGFGWVPNSIDGADYAFKAGRYTQTVYGLVQDGKISIGLTSNKQKAHWVLWANFKLKYEGNSDKAYAKILTPYIETAQAFFDAYSEVITFPTANALEEAIGAAKEAATSSENAEEALNNLNEALMVARENLELINSIEGVLANLDAASEQVSEMEDDDLSNEFEAINEYFSDENYMEDDNESLKAKLYEADAIVKKVNEAYIVWQKEQTYLEICNAVADATDVEPAELTDFIQNADFSAGNIDGWTMDIIQASNKGYQGASYSTEATDSTDAVYISQFVEIWRSNNNPVEGTIYQDMLLPAGTYTLGADVIAVNQGNAAAEIKGAYLYAGDRQIAIASGNKQPRHFDLTFNLTEEKNLVRIGIQALKGTNINWMAADNFTLTAYGNESGKEINGEANAIDEIKNNTQKTIYTLTGVRVNKALKPGLYIVNGKKVVVK